MNDLSNLIQSLSPTEKQHFKKRHSPTADFVILFDYINKKKTCVTSEVLEHLAKNQKVHKKFTSSYLSVVKTYLKNRILESLRIQFIHKRPNYELLSRSMNIYILLEKGLYSLAKREIETLAKKNLDSSFPIERLLLLRRKSIMDYFDNYSNTSMEGIESLFNSRLATAEQLILEIKFARIISIMSFQYFNGLNDPEILKTFMNEPYMQDESLSTDFATRYLFHWVHAQVEEFKNNNEKALDHFNTSIKIWIDNPKYIHAHPRMYLGACYTYFKYLIHQEDPFSNILSDINFDILLSKIETEHLSKEERDRYSYLFHLFEILSFRQQGNSNEIINQMSGLLKDESLLEEGAIYERIVIAYNTAWAYFDCGEFQTAGDILFNLLNPLDKRLANNPVYIAVYILLHIMILLELRNEKHLRQLLSQYKRYLSQEKRLLTFESQFISMASQLISSRFKSTPELVFQRFHTRLSLAIANDQRSIKIEYDFILKWVESKIDE